VTLCAWIHTPGLCGTLCERYNYLRGRGFSTLLFNSSFSLQQHARPRAVVVPHVAPSSICDRYRALFGHSAGSRLASSASAAGAGAMTRSTRMTYSISLASISYLTLNSSAGQPGKFHGVPLPPSMRFLDNHAMPLEEFLSLPGSAGIQDPRSFMA